MGVVDFFEKPEILNSLPYLSKAIIDGNYYYYNFQRNPSFYLPNLPSKTIRNTSEYTSLYLDWIALKFNHCADAVIVVFDSMCSRRHSAWHCKKNNNYISINFEKISTYVFQHNNIKVITCEYDRSQKIVDLYLLHPKNINKYLLNNEKISDIGIFSGNNNYLWTFPFKEECLVLNIVQNDQTTQYSILNNKIVSLDTSNSYFAKKLITEVTSDDCLKKILIKMVGATLPNDYIKHSLWNQHIFQETCIQLKKYNVKTKNSSLFSFLYFERVIEKLTKSSITNDKFLNLVQNSFKFINFMSSGVFYTFDIASVKQIVEKDEISETINLLFDDLTNISSNEIKVKEKNFKNAFRESKKEKILLKSIFSSYFHDNTFKNDPDLNEKFFFICSCSLYMMVLNLSMVYFNETSLQGKTAHFYFAKRVWKHVFVSRKLKNQQFYSETYLEFVDEYNKLFSADCSIQNYIFFKYKSLIFRRPKKV